MNIYDIVKKHLEDTSAEGLVHSGSDCGCGVHDLAPGYDCMCRECEPARAYKCPECNEITYHPIDSDDRECIWCFARDTGYNLDNA